MKQCTACDRHLFGPEPRCPFCGASQAMIRPGAVPLAASLVLGLGLASCGPSSSEPSTTAAAGSSETGTQTTDGTTAVDTADSTSAPATDDGTTIASSDTVDDPDDGPGGFYAGDPDGGGIDFECDVFAQDCPEGEKCVGWSNTGSGIWNATRCVPVAPDPDPIDAPCTVEGGPASGFDSCEAGSMCWHVDPATNEGTCVAMCTGDADDPVCQSPDDTCAISHDGALVLCVDACDPFYQDCPDGQACFFHDEDFVCGLADAGAPFGLACDSYLGCDPGLHCMPEHYFPDCLGDRCCTAFCDLSEPDPPCPGAEMGLECVGYYEDPFFGQENVGICALPR